MPGTAAALLGSLINFRLIESLAESDANGISQERFVSVWAGIYGAATTEADIEPSSPVDDTRRPSQELLR